VYKIAVADVHANMRDLACNSEEQNIANTKIIVSYRLHGLPLGCSCPRYSFAGVGIGVVYKPAAIETGRRRATIPVADTHLLYRDGRRFLRRARGARHFHRRLRAASSQDKCEHCRADRASN